MWALSIVHPTAFGGFFTWPLGHGIYAKSRDSHILWDAAYSSSVPSAQLLSFCWILLWVLSALVSLLLFQCPHLDMTAVFCLFPLLKLALRSPLDSKLGEFCIVHLLVFSQNVQLFVIFCPLPEKMLFHIFFVSSCLQKRGQFSE